VPARRRHSVSGGGAPISYDRRRRRQQNVGGGAQLYPEPVLFSSRMTMSKILVD